MAIPYAPYPAIRIDGSVFKRTDGIKWYERDTTSVLNQICKVDAGKAVLSYIQNAKAGRIVTIKPYNWAYIKATFDKPAKNLFNATAEPLDFALSQDAGQSVLKEAFTGVSRGTDCEIYFTKWVLDNAKYRKLSGVPKSYPGSLPDEVLLHELVHASAQMLGRNDVTSTGDRMGSITEFRSIMVANIYISDPSNPRKGRPLRIGHGGSKAVAGSTGNVSEDFLAVGSYRTYTRDFIKRFPGLALELAAIPASFNPIRQLLKDVAGIP